MPDARSGSTPVRRVEIDARTIVALVGAVVALVVITALVRATPRTVTALAVGTLIALALNPLVDATQRRLSVARGVAVAIVFVGAGVVASALAVVLVPPALDQARDLGTDLPRVVHQLEDLPFVGDDLDNNDVPERIIDWLDSTPDRLRGDLSPVRDAVGSFATGVFAGIIVLLVAVSLLVDGMRLVGSARRLVPQARRATVERIGALAYRAVGRYVAGSVAVALLAGVVTLAAGLILGVPLTPLLAANVMVFDLVPQIGGAAGGIPFVVMGMTQGAGTGVACAVFFLLYLQLENNVISPLVVGQAVKLSPPAMMATALVGVAAGGVVGALLAIPAVGAAKLVYIELRGGSADDVVVQDRPGPRARIRRLLRRDGNDPPSGRRGGDGA